MADMIRKAWLESALLELLRNADSSRLSFVAKRYLQLRLFHNFRHEKGHPDYRPEELIHADISDKFCAIHCRFTRGAEEELLRSKGWRLTQLRGSILKQVAGHLCLELPRNKSGSSGLQMVLEINSFKVIGEPGGAIFGQPLWFQDLNAAQRLLNSHKILKLFSASGNDEEIRSQVSQDTSDSETRPSSQILTQARSAAPTIKTHGPSSRNAELDDKVILATMSRPDTVLDSKGTQSPATLSPSPRRKRTRLHTAWGDFRDLSYYDCQISAAQQKILDTEECWMPPGKYVIRPLSHVSRRTFATKNAQAQQTKLDPPMFKTSDNVRHTKQTEPNDDVDSDAVSWEGSPEPVAPLLAFTRADLEVLRNQKVDHRPPPSSSVDSDRAAELRGPAPMIFSETPAEDHDRDESPPATYRSIASGSNALSEHIYYDPTFSAQSPAPSIPSDYALISSHEKNTQSDPPNSLAVLLPTPVIDADKSEGVTIQADDAATNSSLPNAEFSFSKNVEEDTSILSKNDEPKDTHDDTPIVRASSPADHVCASLFSRNRSSSLSSTQPAQLFPAPDNVEPSRASIIYPKNAAQRTQDTDASCSRVMYGTPKRKISGSDYSEVLFTEPPRKTRKFSPAPYHFADRRISLPLDAQNIPSSVPLSSGQVTSHPYDIARRFPRPDLRSKDRRQVSDRRQVPHSLSTPTRSWQSLPRSFTSASSPPHRSSLNSEPRKPPSTWHSDRIAVALRAGGSPMKPSSPDSDSDDPFLPPKIRLRDNLRTDTKVMTHLSSYSLENNQFRGTLQINSSAAETSPSFPGTSLNMAEMTRANPIDTPDKPTSALAGNLTSSVSSIRSRVKATASSPRLHVNQTDTASSRTPQGPRVPISRLDLTKLQQYDEGRGVDDILRSDRASYLKMRRPPPGYRPTPNISTQDIHTFTLEQSAHSPRTAQPSQVTRPQRATILCDEKLVPIEAPASTEDAGLVPSVSTPKGAVQEITPVTYLQSDRATSIHEAIYAQHSLTSQDHDLDMVGKHNAGEASENPIFLDQVLGHDRSQASGSEQEDTDDVKPSETLLQGSRSETGKGVHTDQSVLSSVLGGVFALSRRRAPVYDVLNWTRRIIGD